MSTSDAITTPIQKLAKIPNAKPIRRYGTQSYFVEEFQNGVCVEWRTRAVHGMIRLVGMLVSQCDLGDDYKGYPEMVISSPHREIEPAYHEVAGEAHTIACRVAFLCASRWRDMQSGMRVVSNVRFEGDSNNRI